ncbi:uncharacterized protein [Nicotiana sylvestris]|uniref:uncharacterized protein n=1 Tax=Nicotiana sylvestris TaxID=4096 RepID=UPI00388CDD74
MEEHEQHLRVVLQTLREQNPYVKFSKCEFWLGFMAFMGNVVSGEGIKVYTNYHSLQHLLKKRDLNMRQRMLLELLKYYDITIVYHRGKVNIVPDALSKKAESLCSLAFISVEERPLALDIQSSANRLIRMDISESIRFLAYAIAQSSLFEQIKARQYDDPHL